MKETGFEHWNYPNTGATNESGFTGLGAGYREFNNGNYYSMSSIGFFWTSTENYIYNVWYRRLNRNLSDLYRYSFFKKAI